MDAVTTFSERVERPAAARFKARADVHAIEPAAHGRDPGSSGHSDIRGLADGLLRVLESERVRVAGVLADEVVSVITMSRYLIEEAMRRLARGEAGETSEVLQNASAWIRDASQQLTTLCSELRPRVLDDLGLLPALSWYLRNFSRENRSIFIAPRLTVAEADVPPDLKLPVFRIVQTALANVARHSKASSARVVLSLFEGELRLEIEDNGVGFDAHRWWRRRLASDGCGLGMICRWVETSGGSCRIEAAPRHGAKVQATWRMASSDPVTEERQEALQVERASAPLA